MFCCFKKSLHFKNNQYYKYDLEGIHGKFYVENVYDGDTITILFPVKQHIYNMNSKDEIDLKSDKNKKDLIEIKKIKLRLYGIDTPELKPSKKMENREEHIQKAIEAKNFLSNLILNQIVEIDFLKNDKYGRPLAIIYKNNIDINHHLIEKGYANKYDGKKKKNF